MGVFGCFFCSLFLRIQRICLFVFFHQADFHIVLVGKVDVFAMDMVKILMLRLRRLLCKVVGRVEISLWVAIRAITSNVDAMEEMFLMES